MSLNLAIDKKLLEERESEGSVTMQIQDQGKINEEREIDYDEEALENGLYD